MLYLGIMQSVFTASIIVLTLFWKWLGLIPAMTAPTNLSDKTPIADYVVEIYEDSKGHLWFGTMTKGVAHYDGETLEYINTDNGLSGNVVASITEDEEGGLWFGTHSGLSRYDGAEFVHYARADGLPNNRISELMIDSRGVLWVGTWDGVATFNGETFEQFGLPIPPTETLWYQSTMTWVTEIIEDQARNIWIGRDGYGASKFDGENFTHFTKKEGLNSNCVQAIREDREGNIWIGTRIVERDHPNSMFRSGAGGLNRYNGITITNFPTIDGLVSSDTYAIYPDTNGDLWVTATGVGVYRYDGENFKLYNRTNRMDLTEGLGAQSMLRDKNGTLWIGFSGGLFRLQGDSIVHVGVEGPW